MTTLYENAEELTRAYVKGMELSDFEHLSLCYADGDGDGKTVVIGHPINVAQCVCNQMASLLETVICDSAPKDAQDFIAALEDSTAHIIKQARRRLRLKDTKDEEDKPLRCMEIKYSKAETAEEIASKVAKKVHSAIKAMREEKDD